MDFLEILVPIVIVLIVLLIIIAIWAIKTRNKFATMRIRIDEQKSNITNYLARRNDYLNDALNIAKINCKAETEGMEKLTSEQKLEQLLFLGQRFPELQSAGNYTQIIAAAESLTNEIRAAREQLNSNISIYNQAIAKFPANIIASNKFPKESFINEDTMEQTKSFDAFQQVDYSQFQ